jgi:lysophospholipase L1-like esterase
MKWYENDVREAVLKRVQCKYEPKTVFYGSSSITLWETLYVDFEDFAPVNLGFGGSTLAACVWFFDEIVAPVQNPQKIILYAGDNDLGDGRQAEEVVLFYRQFVIKLREHFPEVGLYFISIKPSISRANIMDQIARTNALIKEEIEKKKNGELYVNVFDKMIDNKGHLIKKYFKNDGLHLSEKGYEVWKETILNECLLPAKSP